MMGINDPGVYLGYLFAIFGLIACVVYGIIFWNKGMENDITEISKDLEWEEKDEQMNNEI
ncbi:MAG: hypothetical protein EOM73_05275 [Bacteroidia bacterium]|nr:hypothetical protein [Bacteroidia bacterium]